MDCHFLAVSVSYFPPNYPNGEDGKRKFSTSYRCLLLTDLPTPFGEKTASTHCETEINKQLWKHSNQLGPFFIR